jgi:Membrane-bound serine protease (ClpP class)
MDIVIVVVLGIVGILLILAEIFLIPGVTVAAIFGGLSLVGSVWYAFARIGAEAGVITLVAALAVLAFLFVYFVKSKTLNVIGLKTNIDSTVDSGDSAHIHPGDEGITISRLNPVGKVRVNDIVMEARSLGEFIDEDAAVEVVKVTKNQLIVKTK